MSGADVLRFGSNELSFEEPDTIVYRLQGELLFDEARGLVDAHRSWAIRKPYFLALCNVEGHKPAEAKVRKVLVGLSEGLPPRAVALYGASFPVRVMGDMVMRATQIFARTIIDWRFCLDEASSREWLAVQRKRLQAQTGS